MKHDMCIDLWGRSAHFVRMQPFVDNIRRRAKELGLSHAEVARRSGLIDRRYGNYATGIREPDLATLIRIARALHTSPNELLGFDEQPAVAPTKADELKERIAAAVDVLEEPQLEMLLIQAQALAAARR